MSLKKRQSLHGTDKIVEANEIARAQLAPPAESVWEERIIAQIAAYIRQNDGDFPESAFMVGQIVDTKKVSNSQLREIEKASTRLVGSTFKIKNGNNFIIYAVFSFIKFEDGIISAKFNQDLKKYYFELEKQFAVRSLPEFKALSSVYSQQIYRFLNSWSGLPEATIPIAELHHAVNALGYLRENFKEFRIRALEVAHKEINEKTTLKFNWEAIKLGKKVIAIRFIFNKI